MKMKWYEIIAANDLLDNISRRESGPDQDCVPNA